MTRQPRFCIIGLKCYDLLAGVSPPRFIGGIESQLSQLAPGLSGSGMDVSMIVYDQGQPDGQVCRGVRVFKAFDRERGLPVVRFVHPRWTGLNAALARADADVYYQTGAGCETGQIAWWCRRNRRRFIYGVASDSDCDSKLVATPLRRERVLFRYGLHAADLRVTQTDRQRQMLMDRLGLHAIHVPGYCASADGANDGPRRLAGRRLLWVGRIAAIKRPELLIDLAERLPDCTFDVVGEANDDDQCSLGFKAQARRMPSIRLHGRLAPADVVPFYRSADLLINTSRFEGFPVTFIEAWSHSLPVATFFDPDGMVDQHGLGVVAADPADMADRIRQFLASPERWAQASAAACRCFRSRHSVEAAVANFSRVVAVAAGTQPQHGVAP